MNNTDRLFREKLAEHQLAPRPQAWEKLEGQLSKKNRAILWMRLAAALAVISLLTFFLVNRDGAPTPTLAETQATPAEMPKQDQVPAVPEKGLAASTQDESLKPARAKTAKKSYAESVVPTPEEKQPIVKEMLDESAPVAVLEMQEAVEIQSEPTPVSQTKKSIVLTYELPTIAASQVPTEQVVVTGDEKQSGFQKILETAKDVKYSDNPWGELREAKNELLALDFKKDKSRNH